MNSICSIALACLATLMLSPLYAAAQPDMTRSSVSGNKQKTWCQVLHCNILFLHASVQDLGASLRFNLWGEVEYYLGPCFPRDQP
jgi:hypothetical protein